MIRIVSLLVIVTSVVLVYFPYMKFYDKTQLDKKIQAIETLVPTIDKLDLYLEEKENKYPNLRKGLGKSITWHDETKKEQTHYAFVYLPGFTATRKEISPVVEVLAQRFKANSFFSRLPSHGEEADDFSNAQTDQFFETAKEAVVIGERLGKKPIYIGMSTGAALLQYMLNQSKIGFAYIGFSPAFYSNWHFMNVALNPIIGLSLVKMAAGEYYEWKPHFPNQELYWNTKYNTNILPEMTRVFQITSDEDYTKLTIPYLMFYNEQDNVIEPHWMLDKFRQTRNQYNKKIVLKSRDPHVVVGDITSPENTNPVIEEISSWLQEIKD